MDPAQQKRISVLVLLVFVLFFGLSEGVHAVSSGTKIISDINRGHVGPRHRTRVLIVPGHEPDDGGAEFGAVKERDINVDIAESLRGFLAKDNAYTVFIARDKKDWSPMFRVYFDAEWSEIQDWEQQSKVSFARAVVSGDVERSHSSIAHNKASSETATRLYGINRWANDHDIDIVIHTHFNDENRERNQRKPGEASGFAIYVPASEYDNSTTTKAVAEKVFDRVAKYSAVSDLGGESGGIIGSTGLIAVGANNTSRVASLLIEYGYIYEEQFQSKKIRPIALEDLAFQTYLGLEDFFLASSSKKWAGTFDTLVLPHTWPRVATNPSARDIFALQSALIYEGLYPPHDKSKNECPRTGVMGACTRAALRAFQSRKRITGESGVLGKKTLRALGAMVPLLVRRD